MSREKSGFPTTTDGKRFDGSALGRRENVLSMKLKRIYLHCETQIEISVQNVHRICVWPH